jgi:hypothetical protein
VHELVMWVGLPVHRLTPPRQNDTGPIGWQLVTVCVKRLHGYSSRKVHREGNWADNPGCVMHQTNELARRGLADQINNALKWWMEVRGIAALRKENATFEVVNHRLIGVRIPPFGGVIVLSS